VRAPEYVFKLQQEGYEPGTLTITWYSAGMLRTAQADAAGKIAGDAVGELDAPSGTVYLRPLAMIDPGGEFSLSYSVSTQQTEILPAPAPDVAGFALITLAQQPAAGTLSIEWQTMRQVNQTSGGNVSSESVSKGFTVSMPGVFSAVTQPIQISNGS
jgi:hypothetical protein